MGDADAVRGSVHERQEAGRPTLDSVPPQIHDLHLWLNAKLCEVADMLAPEYKLTLIARHPTNENAHIVTTNDDVALASETLLRGRFVHTMGPHA